MGFFETLFNKLKGTTGAERRSVIDRIAGYEAMKRLYDGYTIRKNLSGTEESSELEYNLAQGVANTAADFLAGNPVSWSVTGNEAAEKAAAEIWDRSGGDSKFLHHALDGVIKGDAVVLLKRKPANRDPKQSPFLQWLDPAVCVPTFDPHDCERLTALTIGYDIPGPKGDMVPYMEVWAGGTVTVTVDGQEVEGGGGGTYDEAKYGGVPAVWIANQGLPGECFGRSDIRVVKRLVERYNHLCGKDANITDYYAEPALKMKGASKKDTEQSTIGTRKVFYLPKEGQDVEFLEWQGNQPAVHETLNRTRETIAEVSETPQVAYGKLENSGALSGVALRLLYGPLLAKTRRHRATWGPKLERVMAMALAEAKALTTVDEAAVNIVWGDPLPGNSVEDWQVAGLQEDAGVSTKQVLLERGYSKKQVQEFEAEAEAKAEAARKAFDAGNVPGGAGFDS